MTEIEFYTLKTGDFLTRFEKYYKCNIYQSGDEIFNRIVGAISLFNEPSDDPRNTFIGTVTKKEMLKYELVKGDKLKWLQL